MRLALKKITIAIFVVVVCALSLSACSDDTSDYDFGYREGHSDGYTEGYEDGLDDAPALVEEQLHSEIHALEQRIENEYGMSVEYAFRIISNYADGEPIEEEKLNDAMWAVWEYYINMPDVFYGISSFDID